MAYLNKLYIHITDEELNQDIEVTEHPVEKGAEFTDHINIKGISISLSGKIVDANGKKASDILSQIKKWRDSGQLLSYSGRNAVNDMVIASFSTSHPNTVAGGCEFSMELKQIRIAKNAYVADKKTTSKAVEKKTTVATIKVGEIVVFKGGDVYVSSDAKKKSATRGRSTCKITQISRKSWSIHQIHLISTDGGKVYGWVDEKNIEGVKSANTETKETTKAGTQQVSKGTKKAFKVGDTVIFKGGAVYASSDAKKQSAKKGKSTCKITKIVRYTWATHQIHLKSTDKGGVYGWVDESNIQAK